jgi:hypothetical protein
VAPYPLIKHVHSTYLSNDARGLATRKIAGFDVGLRRVILLNTSTSKCLPIDFDEWLCGLAHTWRPLDNLTVLGYNSIPEGGSLLDYARALEEKGLLSSVIWLQTDPHSSVTVHLLIICLAEIAPPHAA